MSDAQWHYSVLVIPAPFAILCAILAFRDMKKHPDRHGMGRAVFGLIMGILGTGVIALFLVTALVSYAKR
jgi:hypothetical protein